MVVGITNLILLKNDPFLLVVVATLVGINVLSRGIRERENNDQAERGTLEESVQAERRTSDEEAVNSNTELIQSDVISLEWPFEIDILKTF